MTLVAAALAARLQSDWLVPDGGTYPSSPTQAGDAFADAVAGWFAGATAGAFPCSTATARRPQLASAAAAALQTGDATAAGSRLATALAGYIVGQVFGPGVAGSPVAVAPAGLALSAALLDLNQAAHDRANAVAGGVQTLASSTMVVFPPVVSPPVPVT